VVRIRDLGHDGQTEARSPGLPGAGRIQADEPVEYPTPLRHRYAQPIVGDHDLPPGGNLRTFQSNTAVRVPNCIVDEVSHQS
jgi:hypothetical protein